MIRINELIIFYYICTKLLFVKSKGSPQQLDWEDPFCIRRSADEKRLERIGIVGYYPNTATISRKPNRRVETYLVRQWIYLIHALQLCCIELLEKKLYTIYANTYSIWSSQFTRYSKRTIFLNLTTQKPPKQIVPEAFGK